MSNDYKFLVIDDGATTGIREEMKFDWASSQVLRKTTFLPSTGINETLDANKNFLNNGYSPSRDLQHVASIPMAVIGLWIERYGVDPTQKGNEALLARLLNDPEWRDLRTGRGAVNFKE
jgi:hypothetical protein